MVANPALPIRVHPSVIQILGRFLVSDPIRAFTELVKNSYDAGASNALIEFVPGPKPEILVIDDGKGLSPAEIEHGWLEVATPIKRNSPRAGRGGRLFAGSMGIGRLAGFLLADTMTLETRPPTGTWSRVKLNLPAILKHDDLGSLRIPVQQIDAPPEAKALPNGSGTILRLTDLKWLPAKENVAALEAGLALIVGPGEEEFKISIAYAGPAKPVENPEDHPAAPIKLEAGVDGTGRAYYTVSPEPNLYVGPRKLPKGPYTFDDSAVYPLLRNVKLTAFWYPRGDRPAAQYWKKSQLQESLAGYFGIKLYRDEIRVLPYGEGGNDWLGLEEQYVRAGATERHVRPTNTVGWVSISRVHNPELQDVANREGLLKNDAFHALRAFCQKAFSKVAEVRRILEPVTRQRKRVESEDIKDALDSIRKLKRAVRKSPKNAARVEALELTLSQAQEEIELMAVYRDKLTAGNLLRLILHDAGASLRAAQPLFVKAAESKCDIKVHHQALDIVSDLSPRLIGAYDLLKGAGRRGAYKKGKVDVAKTVQAVVRRFKDTITIQAELQAETESLTANVREADIWALSVNLIHNALTSAEYEQARNRNFPQERKIVFRVKRHRKDLVLECEDNGPGLPDKPSEWIWAQFNSTRGDGGSGLGLWIVNDVVISYAGTREAEKSQQFPTGALFRITLPGVIENA